MGGGGGGVWSRCSRCMMHFLWCEKLLDGYKYILNVSVVFPESLFMPVKGFSSSCKYNVVVFFLHTDYSLAALGPPETG